VQRIEELGKRVSSYVEFMCQAIGTNCASAEATERSVTAFYERMVSLEGELRQIHDNLRLE
jgi:hypothetical protein